MSATMKIFLGCGLLAILALVVALLLGGGVLAWFSLTAEVPPDPPAADGGPLPPALPVMPQGTAVAPGIAYADYLGSWFAVDGEPGEDNTIVMRLEGGQLVCISADGANRLTLALQADGSVYGVAYGEGMNVPVRCQLTADKQQMNLTALYEASEPSTTVYQRVK